jgi:transposase
VGKKTGPNPTDRGKCGTKRSLLTDGGGVPLAVAVAGANAHDKTLVQATLRRFAVRRPRPKPGERKQHFCGDKGYDSSDVRTLLYQRGYTLHIKSRGQEETERRSNPRYRARRWVVERSHSWINRFRRLLIRWEKKAENYEAFLHFACAWITLQATGVFG